MNKAERLEAVREKYSQAKESNDLVRKGSRRATNPLDTFSRKDAEAILSDVLKDGKTIVPIDLVDFWTAQGLKMDWLHNVDKTARYFEILVLSQVKPELANQITSIYGTETTKILRSVFMRGKNFVVESNKAKNLAFLSIDVSNLINPISSE